MAALYSRRLDIGDAQFMMRFQGLDDVRPKVAVSTENQDLHTSPRFTIGTGADSPAPPWLASRRSAPLASLIGYERSATCQPSQSTHTKQRGPRRAPPPKADRPAVPSRRSRGLL